MSARSVDVEPAADGVVRVVLAGDWTRGGGLSDPGELAGRIDGAARTVRLDVEGVTDWDSVLLVYLRRTTQALAERDVEVDLGGLPKGIQQLLALASAVPEKETGRHEPPAGVLKRIGTSAMASIGGTREIVTFVGEATIALGRFCVGKARFRRQDFVVVLEDCGPDAVPIVTLISFLVGLILAFIGAIQLRQFGAQIYVADLVGIGMAREMAAMMTAIIMAGRTGAAFAAQLGTMTVNEEIDALKTMGFSPMEFLVLPRLLALAAMVPLLCLFSNLMGILGGMTVGVGMMDLTITEYLQQTRRALDPLDFGLGLVKGAIYGVLVALAGCLRGMQCGRSAQAVGAAATSAVVTGIVWIVVASAITTVLYDVLGL